MNSSILVAFVVVVLVAVVLAYLVLRMTSNRNTTLHAPETPTGPKARFSPTRAVLVIVLTAVIAASSILMVGPQIMVIVPVALLVGIVFAVGRSSWSLVCFGYPLTFGLILAWIGYLEVPGYERTTAAGSIGIGLAGCVLIAMGLWKALPGRSEKRMKSYRTKENMR